jgi:hypothetical protein
LSLHREGEPLEEPGDHPANQDWIERFCRTVDQYLDRNVFLIKVDKRDSDNHA